MVLFILCVKADLEGVSALSIAPNANICMSARNPLSDFEVREKIVLNVNETIEQEENTREPPCHFAIKWEGSKKRSTIEILNEGAAKTALKKSGKKGKSGSGSGEVGQPRDVTPDDNGGFVPVLMMECRGVEPYAFHVLGDEFIVTSEGGKKFDSDVDLSEGDWADYDEENDMSVSISNFETKIVSV